MLPASAVICKEKETIDAELLCLIAEYISGFPCGAGVAKELFAYALSSGLLPRKHTLTGSCSLFTQNDLQSELKRLGKTQLMWIIKDWMSNRGCKSLFSRPISFQSISKLNTSSLLRLRASVPILFSRSCSIASKYVKMGKVSGHYFEVLCLEFDRLRNCFITGSNDWTLKVWNAETGWLLRTLRGHIGEIEFISINRENTMIASGSTDGTVRVWALHDGYPVAILRTPTINQTSSSALPLNRVNAVLWSNTPFEENRFLIAATRADRMVRLWHWKRRSDPSFPGEFSKPITLCNFARKCDYPICLSLDAAGLRLAIGGSDGIVRIFSTRSLVQKHLVPFPQCSLLRNVEISDEKNDNSFFSFSDEDKSHEIIFSSVEELYSTKSPTDVVFPQDISSTINTNSLLSLDINHSIKCIAHLPLSSSLVDVHFSNCGDRFVAASADGSVSIWFFDNFKKLWTPITLLSPPTVFSGRKIKLLPKILVLCWLCDDRAVVTATTSGQLIVFDSTTGNIIFSVVGTGQRQELSNNDSSSPQNNQECIEILTIVPHPALPEVFLSATYEKPYVALWQIGRMEPLWQRRFDGTVGECKFSLDGEILLVSHFNDISEQIQFVYSFSLGMKPWTCPVQQYFSSDFVNIESGDGTPILHDHSAPFHLENPQYVRPRDGEPYQRQPLLISRLDHKFGLEKTELIDSDERLKKQAIYLANKIEAEVGDSYLRQIMSTSDIRKHVQRSRIPPPGPDRFEVIDQLDSNNHMTSLPEIINESHHDSTENWIEILPNRQSLQQDLESSNLQLEAQNPTIEERSSNVEEVRRSSRLSLIRQATWGNQNLHSNDAAESNQRFTGGGHRTNINNGLQSSSSSGYIATRSRSRQLTVQNSQITTESIQTRRSRSHRNGPLVVNDDDDDEDDFLPELVQQNETNNIEESSILLNTTNSVQNMEIDHVSSPLLNNNNISRDQSISFNTERPLSRNQRAARREVLRQRSISADSDDKIIDENETSDDSSFEISEISTHDEFELDRELEDEESSENDIRPSRLRRKIKRNRNENQILQREADEDQQLSNIQELSNNIQEDKNDLLFNPLDKEQESDSDVLIPLWRFNVSHDDENQYFPQHGDHVVYFREGHLQFLTHYSKFYPGPTTDYLLPVESIFFAVVKEVQFYGIQVLLILCSMNKDNDDDNKKQKIEQQQKLSEYTVCYREHQLPDFIILQSKFKKCNLNHNPGDLVTVIYSGPDQYKAKILDRKDNSIWNCYSVLYESSDANYIPNNEDEDNCCPWELEFQNSSRDIDLEYISSDLRDKCLNVISRLFRRKKNVDIDNKSSEHMKGYEIHHWRPISLLIVVMRLEKNYYRHLDELLCDLRCLLLTRKVQKNPSICSALVNLMQTEFSFPIINEVTDHYVNSTSSVVISTNSNIYKMPPRAAKVSANQRICFSNRRSEVSRRPEAVSSISSYSMNLRSRNRNNSDFTQSNNNNNNRFLSNGWSFGQNLLLFDSSSNEKTQLSNRKRKRLNAAGGTNINCGDGDYNSLSEQLSAVQKNSNQSTTPPPLSHFPIFDE